MSAARDTGGTAAIGYDVATALWQGRRPYQEDTLLADFHGGMDRGFAVLADGMGGHAAGDLASRLVVIDAVSHLKFLIHDGATLEKNLASELTSAIETANDVLRDRAAEDSRLQGMGATFLATVMFEDRLYWASVGDSPLYLWREGELRQLNEDHSMAPIIDQMAKSGEITEDEAANHPDRNALTSVLMGRKVKTLDVPKTATVLDPGDILIQASDGLQYLGDDGIAKVLKAARGSASSREIAGHLMRALQELDDPAQDNTAIMVLQLTEGMGGAAVASDTKAVSALERAVEAASAGAAGVSRTTGAAVADALPAGTPGAVPQPPGGRRWLVPAALLGGAALALGLIFGLPSEQDAIDLAEGTSAPGTAEPGAPLPTEPDPAVALSGGTPDDTVLQADVSSAAPDLEATSPPVAGEDGDGVAEATGEILIEDGPAADPAPAQGADLADPVEGSGQPSPRAGESGGGDPGNAEEPSGLASDAPAPVDPETADATPGEDAAEAGGGVEPGPDEEPATGMTTAMPQRSGDAAGAGSAPIPRPVVAAPQTAPDTRAVIDAAPAEAVAPEVQVPAGEAAAPVSPVPEAAAIVDPGNAANVPAPSGNGAEIAGAAAPEAANDVGPDPVAPAPIPAPVAPAPAPAPLTLAPQPQPLPAPIPVPTPAPEAPQAGGTGSPVQIVPTPGIGRVNETMSAPPGAPAPAPAPDALPPLGPSGPRIQFVPQSEAGNVVPSGGSTQTDQATLTAPDPVRDGRAPPHPELGPRAMPVLPPFTTSIQGICQRHGCFAIITQRSNRLVRQQDRPRKYLNDH